MASACAWFLYAAEIMAVDVQQTSEQTLRTIWAKLTDGAPVVITSHERLDGDGLGSALALRQVLQDREVDVRVALQPPTPPMFAFLPGMAQVLESPEGLPDSYTLAVVDCGNFRRVGPLRNSLTGRGCTVNIDHHDTNTMFGDLNYVEGWSSSSGEMLHRLFRTVGVEMTPPVAECLFTAVMTDTGRFSHQDTTPRAFIVCAECVEAGVKPNELVQKCFFSPTPAQMRLRHLAMGTLRFHCEGGIASMEVTKRMFERTGLAPIDTEGFAEVPIAVRGVRASALLKEMPGCGYIKVSMRSKDAVDVCRVARSFGGGGHTHAAGCEIYDESLEQVRRAVVDKLQEQLPD